MNLHALLATKNECYITNVGTKWTPKGVMIHSTGANNPNLKRYVGPDDGLLGTNVNGNHWNQYRPDGKQICCHAFIGKLADGTVAVYQTLPWDYRCWLSGSGSNGVTEACFTVKPASLNASATSLMRPSLDVLIRSSAFPSAVR